MTTHAKRARQERALERMTPPTFTDEVPVKRLHETPTQLARRISDYEFLVEQHKQRLARYNRDRANLVAALGATS